MLDYTYDFGDSWEHRLTVTDVRPGEPDTAYPRYVAGERAAPPEDCDGIPVSITPARPWPTRTIPSTKTWPSGTTATTPTTSTNSR